MSTLISLALAMTLALGLQTGPAARPGGDPPPTPQLPGLTLDLIAEQPALVTPTGVAVDRQGRVFVIESHTHFPPEGYTGPKSDRIRLFEDPDGDGQFDAPRVVFEGTRHTMNLAFEADGRLLVVTRMQVFRLTLAADGTAAGEPEVLAKLDTKGDYPHNGLSGFAVAFDGTIYFGMGENLGEGYTLTGKDGTALKGGGEGGNVFRIQPDGTGLTRFATGFWNPFHLTLDPFGRLFVVDNDPDSRPPCRLLHVVEGGDYGYRFRNGRKGLHPFTAWDGELPGTLPMVAGTGEAPSGVVWYGSDALPELRGSILSTSWGDHRIDRFQLEPAGASTRGARAAIATGDDRFRPVGIAVAPDGSMFVTDWVDRSYNVHGQGRLWRIRPTSPPVRTAVGDPAPALRHLDRAIREQAARTLTTTPEGRQTLAAALADRTVAPAVRALALEALALARTDDARAAIRSARTDPDPLVRALAVRLIPEGSADLAALAAADQPAPVRAEALRRLGGPPTASVLRAALADPDAFVRQAARSALARTIEELQLATLARSPAVPERLAALLIERDRDTPEARALVATFLDDADPVVRQAAVQWVAESRLAEFRDGLERAVSHEPSTDALLRSYLAARAALDGQTTALDQGRADGNLLRELAGDPARSAALRRLATRGLGGDDSAEARETLRGLLGERDPALRREALAALLDRGDAIEPARLAAIAGDATLPLGLRAEAIAGLATPAADRPELLIPLLTDAEPALRRQAARSLRGASVPPATRSALAPELASLLGLDGAAAAVPSPGAGDPAEGARVFFNPKGPGCYRCHQVDGRGSRIGPDLTGIGRSGDRDRLVRSIVQPSAEIAPQFTTFQLARTDGTVVNGLFLVEQGDGGIQFAGADGKTFVVHPRDIEARQPVPVSIMPEGLDRLMTAAEFRDLLAYLGDPKAAAGPTAEKSSGSPEKGR